MRPRESALAAESLGRLAGSPDWYEYGLGLAVGATYSLRLRELRDQSGARRALLAVGGG